MKAELIRITRIAASKRIGLAVFLGLLLITILVIGLPRQSYPKPLSPSPIALSFSPGRTGNTPLFTAAFSQTSVIQNSLNPLYLELGIEVPEQVAAAGSRKPTSLAVVLDRSGSMAAENKLAYAKAAVRSLLALLGEQDKFALVGFDSEAQVYSPLVSVASSNRQEILSRLESITPGSSTNIGSGLQAAGLLLSRDNSERLHKLILLSDGQVNTGVKDPSALASMVQQLVEEKSVVSSIGMGLDFNETLMASLADRGNGSYTYLENLSGLDEVLAKDLSDARRIYARSSNIELQLPEGARVLNAGGYLMENTAAGRIRLSTGQLLSGAKKHITLTLEMPAKEIGRYPISAPILHYAGADGEKTLLVEGVPLELTVLRSEQKNEALASINRPLLERVWQVNNLGVMRQQLAEQLRNGDRAGAEKVVAVNSSALAKAENEYGIRLGSKELEKSWSSSLDEISKAFMGSFSEQQVKRNSAAKANGLYGRELQLNR